MEVWLWLKHMKTCWSYWSKIHKQWWPNKNERFFVLWFFITFFPALPPFSRHLFFGGRVNTPIPKNSNHQDYPIFLVGDSGRFFLPLLSMIACWEGGGGMHHKLTRFLRRKNVSEWKKLWTLLDGFSIVVRWWWYLIFFHIFTWHILG